MGATVGGTGVGAVVGGADTGASVGDIGVDPPAGGTGVAAAAVACTGADVAVAGDVAAGGEGCSPPPQPASAKGIAKDSAASASRACGKIRRQM